ncbi:FHA domain-containing protein [Mycobacterium sp. M1]|uniref:FHA domain-containing protein n=1 Tax=Mycolicibacter acidiphilus TaxID=2835306 RepID=A0ABS5RLT6_9MYCO|nr:FHA domain-containing protein [Mycolicibacter acidiphilus]MBS9533899.1 FHA domain-containing protein [Mycolicibacter acidiphilus]
MTRDSAGRRWEMTTPYTGGLIHDLAADEDTDTAGLLAFDDLPESAAALVVKRGPNAGTRFPLDRPVTVVGRHPNSDIYLEDDTVSRRHVEFHCADDGFRVVDTASLNGTYVNRQPIQSAALAHGDEIQIGNFRLVFLVRPLPG